MRRFSLLASGLCLGLSFPSLVFAQEAPVAPDVDSTSPDLPSSESPDSAEQPKTPNAETSEENDKPSIPFTNREVKESLSEGLAEGKSSPPIFAGSDTETRELSELEADVYKTRRSARVENSMSDVDLVAETAPEVSAVYKPLISTVWNGMYFALPLQLSGAAESTSSFGLDRYGTMSSSEASVQPLVRIGGTFSSLKKWSSMTLQAEYEHDVYTGRAGQGLEMDDEGLVIDAGRTNQLRKAYAVVGIKNKVWLGAGAMTSSWGLGLIANAGDQVWEPGSARFSSQRGGDRVLRAFAVVGINERLGMALRLGGDSVLGDDILLSEEDRLRGGVDPLVEDDDAHQFVAALTVGEGKATSGGVYAAYRNQSAVTGETTEVIAVDAHVKRTQNIGESRLEVEGEAVLIVGDTEWAPTMDFSTHTVRQLGVAARASYHHPKDFGAVADFLYASGDDNFDDEAQTAFKVDRNYDMGMLLFRQVLSGQTARAVATASDLDLVGEPSEDIERFATRGSISNTISFFPRGYYRPMKGLEIYGGPLLALTVADYADPLNSRLAGGTPRNAQDAKPGRYLGTELDLGIRYRKLVAGSELTIGVEGGVLMPGSVFDDAEGSGLGSVYGVRTVLNYKL